MRIAAALPVKGRDVRLDLFRVLASPGIFRDHIPNDAASLITTRNYGFGDAADPFIFISGWTVASRRGPIIGASRLTKRVRQIYVATSREGNADRRKLADQRFGIEI